MKKENKRDNSMSAFYLFLILFFGWIFTQFIAFNEENLIIKENEITGLQIGTVDPLKTLGDFFSTPIKSGGETIPVWALILTFAMVFSTLFILVKKIHLFKNDENRGPAIIFSLATSLLTVFATNIAGLIYYIATTIVYLVVIIALLLIGWAGYLGLHTSVSSGFKDIASVAGERYQAKEAANQARAAYFQTATGYDTAKQERGVLKSLKDKVFKKDKYAIENLLTIFDNLTNKQLSVNQNVNKVLDRISRYGIPTGKKKIINDLVRDIKTIEGNFESRVKEIRNHIEKVKSFIKSDDFASAESTINRALEKEQDLEKWARDIAQKEIEINRILTSP